MSQDGYFSYKKLMKKMIDLDISNKDLMEQAHISKSSFYKIKNSENITTDILLRICGALNCDIDEIMEYKNKNETNNIDSGQIFTKAKVAELMIELITVPKESSLLDPCFGEGVFLEVARQTGFTNVTGYEIDKKIYNKVIDEYPSYNLFNQDFLKVKKKDVYDAIIMNPPYIRHEKIDLLEPYGITKNQLSENPLFEKLPKNSNMYMYFILKALDVLKQDGELIVIFPTSWKNTNLGSFFEQEVNTLGKVSHKYEVSGSVFEDNPMIDVFIYKIIKTNKEIEKIEKHIYFHDDDNLNPEVIENVHTRIEIDFPLRLKDISKIRRGLTTGYNGFFMNPPLEDSVERIIASPKDIKGYVTRQNEAQKILVINEESVLTKDTKDYINKYENEIILAKKPKTLYEKIINGNDKWFYINKIESEGIIFSYIIRENIKFILNKDIGLVRDNFYIIKPQKDINIIFVLLNSYYTYYQLETLGKNHGGGVLKLQRYDMEKIVLPNYLEFSKTDLKKLNQISLALQKTRDGAPIVEEISKIISKYSNVKFEKVKKEYLDLKNIRLKRD